MGQKILSAYILSYGSNILNSGSNLTTAMSKTKQLIFSLISDLEYIHGDTNLITGDGKRDMSLTMIYNIITNHLQHTYLTNPCCHYNFSKILLLLVPFSNPTTRSLSHLQLKKKKKLLLWTIPNVMRTIYIVNGAFEKEN